MKIIHVTDCYQPRLGGIELQVRDLAARQARLGHRVTVLTSTAPGPSGEPGCPAALAPEPVEVIRICGRRARPEGIGYRAAFASARGLGEVLADYDAVHTHVSIFSPLAMLATRAAASSGVATVATSHSMWARSEHHLALLRRIVGWADLPAVWTAVSTVAAEPLRRVIGDRAPVSVLPNGVDPPEWRVEPCGGPPGVLRIAVVSRLARRKRVLQLIEVLQIVNDGLPGGNGLHVEVLGDGPQRAEIERYLRRHRMEGWIRLRGRCDRQQIRETFARSDLFIAPATLESFGIAALEARCAGLPVVARAGTGVEDFVAHDREGWLVESDAAMVETLSFLARTPEALARVANHNRVAPPSVSWASVLELAEAAYAQAVALQGREVSPAAASAPDGPAGARAAGVGAAGVGASGSADRQSATLAGEVDRVAS